MRALALPKAVLTSLVALSFVMLLPSLAQADIRDVTSKGGVKAWLVEDHTLPLISISFAFEGGAAIDPNGQEGVSTLLAATMDEGAGDLDSKAFQTALAERSISLGFSADQDAIFGKLKMPRAEKDNAVALMRLALHAPRFDQEAIDRMRDSLITNRQYGMSDPDWLAGQGLARIAMKGHPYGRPTDGTLSSLRSLSKAHLVEAFKAHIVRNRVKIAVVGDISPSELALVLDYLFGDLPEGAAEVDVPAFKPTGRGTVALIEKNQPQTVLLATTQGLTRDDPDWFAALISSYVLGGDFQSRLMNEIRVKRGLTYGISAGLQPFKTGGLFTISSSSDNAKTAEVLSLLQEEMRKMAKSGVTDSELADAKTYLTGSFALRFSSSSRIADVLLDIQRLGFPATYVTTRAKEIAKVTKADVARVAEWLMVPEDFAIVLVGAPEKMSPTETLSVTP